MNEIDNTLRLIRLHGRLGELFGREHRLAVKTPKEAVRALCFLHPGFRKELSEGAWHVIRGELETGFHLEPETLGIGLGKAPLHIVPATVGAGGGNGGGIKTVIGIAIIATAFILAPEAAPGAAGAFLGADMGATAFAGITFGQIALLGAAVTLSGIASMVAPTPKTNIGQTVDQKPSYTLSGPQNTAVEGVCVPVVYGRVMVGSVVGAATMTVADYGANSPNANVSAGDKAGLLFHGST